MGFDEKGGAVLERDGRVGADLGVVVDGGGVGAEEVEAQAEGAGGDGADPPEEGAALGGEHGVVGRQEVPVRHGGDEAAVRVVEQLDARAAEVVGRAGEDEELLGARALRVAVPDADQFLQAEVERFERAVGGGLVDVVADVVVVVGFEEGLEADDGVEEVGHDGFEVVGGDAVRVVDQLLELAEVELLDRFDAALQRGEGSVVAGDDRRHRLRVDVVVDQGLIAAADVGDVVGAFVKSGSDVDHHDWSGSRE